ncbi:MAG: hypothetical protein ABI612_12955 [Betaproteobacteria bacterium]
MSAPPVIRCLLAETVNETTQRMILHLPDGKRAAVTFVKKQSKKGKTTRWFWTRSNAVIVEE